ncbi:MAG: ATP-binding protein [Pseudomonadota bacterium]
MAAGIRENELITPDLGEVGDARQGLASKRPLRAGVLVSLLIIASVAIASVGLVAFSYFKDQAVARTTAQAGLYARLLERSIERYRYLPTVLAQDLAVQQAAGSSDHLLAVSQRLDDFAQVSGLEAIYVMDGGGTVRATSNYDATVSFLGQNYGFRPYFIEALAGRVGEYFAVGATTGRPGYFIAAPVAASGVVAVKLDVAELQAVLAQADVPVIVTDGAGVVVLSSKPGLLYTSLADTGLDGSIGTDPRQFGQREILSADWQQLDEAQVRLAGETYLVGSASIKAPNWQVRYLLPAGQVTSSALGATSLAALAILSVLLLATFLRSRRIEVALATSREARKRLSAANADLSRAQFRLRQRDKLVTLGHLSACISHELSQPISAMRNHLAAAEFEGGAPSENTLDRLSRLVERISGITRQLRFFATGDEETPRQVDVASVISNAVDLVRHDAEKDQITLQVEVNSKPPLVEGMSLRLEQAVVNLLRNALRAAVDGVEPIPPARPMVIISADSNDRGEVAIRISDTGPGVRGVELERLTEPFVTTRVSGEGMGLGLAIVDAIASEHGGRLEVESSDDGACFSIVLPVAQGPSKTPPITPQASSDT